MKKTSVLIFVFVLLLVISAAMYYAIKRNTVSINAPIIQDTNLAEDNVEYSAGVYTYQCMDNSKFNLLFTPNMEKARLLPIEGAGLSKVDFMSVAVDSGVRYESGDTFFTAKGETVTLSIKGKTQTCNPLTSGNDAPFNFGE